MSVGGQQSADAYAYACCLPCLPAPHLRALDAEILAYVVHQQSQQASLRRFGRGAKAVLDRLYAQACQPRQPGQPRPSFEPVLWAGMDAGATPPTRDQIDDADRMGCCPTKGPAMLTLQQSLLNGW